MVRPLLRVRVLLPALLLALTVYLARQTATGSAPLQSALATTPLPRGISLKVADAPWREAAEAMRREDFETARRRLAPLAAGEDPDGLRARLILGFYAHAAEEPELARSYLLSAAGATEELEDWRLYLLGDSLRAVDDLPAARTAVLRLLDELPDSPLRLRALELAADLSLEQGDLAGTLDWIDLARRESTDRETLLRLETIAWETARSLGDVAQLETHARRLLVDHPVDAAELQALGALTADGAKPDWSRILTPDELVRRGASLLEADQLTEALVSLDAIPEKRRDNDWTLLRAEILTERHQGSEALSVLEDIVSEDRRENAEIAWQRSLAALDAARRRRGRANLLTSRREVMASFARESLQWIIEQEIDPEIGLRAHRRLFAELAREDDAADEALAALVALREVDPGETRGREFLWKLGWKAYADSEPTAAIDRWRSLGELYPQSTHARWGRYWTARALEKLGRADEAQTLYRRIASSDTTDFYRRHALLRLTGEEPPPEQQPAEPRETWPVDPLLDRARLLSDLGLGELALIELEALREETDPRAFHGVQATALADTGDRRESIRAIRRTFPALGGARQSSVPRDALELYYPLDFRELVVRHAGERRLEPELVMGMIRQESAFDAEAKSWAGARGLMQIVPSTGRETARRLGLRFSTDRLTDPEFSIRLGTAYFRQVMDMFDDEVELALAGYNGGPYRIRRLWREAGSGVQMDEFIEGLPLEETKTYVKRILLLTDSYRRLYADRAL